MHRLALGAFVALLGLCGLQGAPTTSQVPIVIWHGLGDSCYNEYKSVGLLKALIKYRLGDGYTKPLCFGTSLVLDTAAGIFGEANQQVEMACQAIAADEQLKDGYHAIGLSQGGQFLRAVAQRCPSPPMKTLVSLGGQHQGVYGLPHCASGAACDAAREAVTTKAYSPEMQNVVQAQFWHDALSPERYRSASTFIAKINNDVEDATQRNQSYAENLNKLERLVLVRFNDDKMVVPPESSWFEFFAPNSTSEIVPLNESAIYTEDWIGLKKLDESGRLERLAIDGDHLQFGNWWFLTEIFDKYLLTAA